MQNFFVQYYYLPVIPASVKIISGAAFADCKNLKKVVFEGDRMDELSGCFQRCTALQSVTLPRNVGKMTAEMFYGCTNLTSVRLPDNLKELPQHTFMDCAKLTTVTVPASVTRMGNDVFDGSGVVSLDLSHVMEFDEFGSIGCCANLKNLIHVLTWEGLHVRAMWGGKEKANSKLNAGSKFKAAAKKSSDDDRNTGESKKESAKKIVKQIGKGLKGLLK